MERQTYWPNLREWERNLYIVLWHERRWMSNADHHGSRAPSNYMDIGAFYVISQLQDTFQKHARTKRFDAFVNLINFKMVEGSSWVLKCQTCVKSNDMRRSSSFFILFDMVYGDNLFGLHKRRFRSKEDNIQDLSQSVYVTNFPANCGTKELREIGAKHGTLVDVFIANRLSKADGHKNENTAPKKIERKVAMLNSSSHMLEHMGGAKAVFAKVKHLHSIPNLKAICNDQGFLDISLKYVGGLWVLIEFPTNSARTKFLTHKGMLHWLNKTLPWSRNFVPRERLIWLDIKGIPLSALGVLNA
ncbi:hypothetical protein Tco_1124640 [Tanacetum coccineum]|uniref:DUF4283 domain-containing protein n=1 Tax=Tanacetum coccineum TaxID=301880 RepID=A0ABQ5J8D5_9ASTR